MGRMFRIMKSPHNSIMADIHKSAKYRVTRVNLGMNLRDSGRSRLNL